LTSLGAEVERLNREVTLLLQRLHTTELEHEGVLQFRLDLNGIEERLTEFETRITAVSTELANQITELGTELASLDRPPAHEAEAMLTDLRDAQTRLASEQARYQIAFRQDLAELADRLRPR